MQIAATRVDHGNCSVSGQTLTCDLAFINPTQTIDVLVSGTVTGTGTLTATAQAAAFSEPVNLRDDDATALSISVSAPATPVPPSQAPAIKKGPSHERSGVRVRVKGGGRPAIGQTLTALLPAIAKNVSPVHLRWQAKLPVKGKKQATRYRWTAIRGASKPSYRIGTRLLGRRLRLLVIIGRGKAARILASPPTAPVRAKNGR
jgi:hypothetical protein